ncbi:MAG: DUF6588 family protein [bacterium]
MKRALIVLSFLCLGQVQSQNLENILLAADDASRLTENYVSPLFKGLMNSINGGWYTTAKTHKILGFDITINLNGAFVPAEDEIFNFNPNDYTFLSLPNGESNLPTAFSNNSSETTVDVSVPLDDGTFKVASFEMPGGLKDDLPFNTVPTPMVQFGLGLPTSTDVKLRFVPKLTFDEDIEANLLGLGLQHDITQYLGPIDRLPLSVSVLAAYTNIQVSYEIEDQSDTDDVTISNGISEFKMNTWTFQAIGSLDFKLVTLYGSLGYNTGNSTIRVKGDYNLTYDIENSDGEVIDTIDETVSDPINLNFNTNGFRSTVGARLNLGFFKIFGDYTFQFYDTLTFGIAFSFR